MEMTMDEFMGWVAYHRMKSEEYEKGKREREEKRKGK
tara:strand:+ start:353 stop:463 length:111 start_codon:yes stop_codon:yes gene_type:complete